MRKRFKPSVSNSRAGRGSNSSPNVNASGNVCSNNSTVNVQLQETTSKNIEDKSSESEEATVVTKPGQSKTAELKTSATSSTPVPASSRRSRIKPAVTPVARTRPNSGSKDKTTTAVATRASTGTKESLLSVAQGHATTSCNSINRLTSSKQEEQEAGLSSEEILRSPSLKERNQQAKPLTRHSTEASASVTNTEQRSQRVAQEPVIKPSQAQNKNTNSENAVTHASDNGATPSLLRRKRVLPNLGSASRRRHSSVSKENVEKTPDVLEVRHEEVVTTGKDLGHISEQSPSECSGSRSKRLHTLSEEEKTADHGVLPSVSSDVHNKEDDEEEDNKRKGVKRKRGGRPRKLKEPSDPSQMTMQHLIYCNPKTNPMTSSVAGKKKKGGRNKGKVKGKDKNSQNKESGEEKEAEDNPPSVSGSPSTANPSQDNKEASVGEDDADGAAVAPRVKLDSDGNIILDEESLLIPKSPEKTLDDSEIVYEDADEVNFGAYLKHRKVGRWSLEETQTFYKALSQVGTDFSLMAPLFPTRIRRELKAKFKREEKLHRSLVEKALRVRNPIEVELFTPKVVEEEMDGDKSTVDNGTSTQPTEEVSVT